jgi:hypothetical protein
VNAVSKPAPPSSAPVGHGIPADVETARAGFRRQIVRDIAGVVDPEVYISGSEDSGGSIRGRRHRAFRENSVVRSSEPGGHWCASSSRTSGRQALARFSMSSVGVVAIGAIDEHQEVQIQVIEAAAFDGRPLIEEGCAIRRDETVVLTLAQELSFHQRIAHRTRSKSISPTTSKDSGSTNTFESQRNCAVERRFDDKLCLVWTDPRFRGAVNQF